MFTNALTVQEVFNLPNDYNRYNILYGMSETNRVETFYNIVQEFTNTYRNRTTINTFLCIQDMMTLIEINYSIFGDLPPERTLFNTFINLLKDYIVFALNEPMEETRQIEKYIYNQDNQMVFIKNQVLTNNFIQVIDDGFNNINQIIIDFKHDLIHQQIIEIYYRFYNE